MRSDSPILTVVMLLMFHFSFRDDDDINDVASMAGVNVCEENARILATSSEFVGRVTRSCKDEAFLSASSLTRRALEIGETHKLGRKCTTRS